MSRLLLPKLVVFDLDLCLWHPEMYILNHLPTAVRGPLGNEGEGVAIAQCGKYQVRLFPDALKILQELYRDVYPGVRIAVASSADTPRAVEIARACIDTLEILPGVTMRQVLAKGWPSGFEGNLQIGRTPPLTSNKGKSHFPFLHQETGIDYSDMVFFDDCNWDDNCRTVERLCPGVVTQCTPSGLQMDEWRAALQAFADKRRS